MNTNLPTITKKQTYILYLFYKFRFLNTNHLQHLLNHKNPHRTQSWLKDLTQKSYLIPKKQTKSFIANTQPRTYYLGTNARRILKKNENCDLAELDKIYRSSIRSCKFITHCFTIADIYLFFRSTSKKNEELLFFTQSELVEYDYFPHTLPSAYIARKSKNRTHRYFLDLFEFYDPPFVLRQRVKRYLNYAASGEWEEHTDNEPFPMILLVFSTERQKRHIYLYTQAVLKKNYEEKIQFFLTTKENFYQKENQHIWEEVTW